MAKQAKQGKPMIDLRDDLPRELKVKVRSSVHDLIAKYGEFYQATESFRPDDNKIVDGALKAFFDEEEGFQDWLKKQPKTNGSSPARAPAGSAAPQS